MTAAAETVWSEIPVAAGGFAVVLVAILALARYLLLDKSAANQQKEEINLLRRDLADLRTKVDHLEGELGEQRSLKHQALNDLAVARGVLHVVSQLAVACSCGALSPVEGLLTDARQNRKDGL